jgi:EAL domain-containing protein (putative c-di-GMP-specific phosphodiesterase class I)
MDLQGFLLSPPVPIDEFHQLLSTSSPTDLREL